MKSKSTLVLIELVVMALVFALAAALCLRTFTAAERISQQSADLDRAVLLAQNTAETIKVCGGVEEAAAAVGGDIRQTLWSSYYTQDLFPAADAERGYYHVDVLPEDSGVAGLGQAHIAVFQRDGNEELFSLTVVWQEVSGDGA